MNIQGRNIVLGVGGGIAAYKSVELLRLLVKEGARVRVIMTENAASFVGPLTFAALSGNPVCTSLFDNRHEAAITHIEWARQAEAVVLAPATANIIGKLAAGIADDALSTLMLAVTAPVLICPSMNTHMYENRAVQRNLAVLRQDGLTVLEPDAGELACGTSGAGRMPEPEIIVNRLNRLLAPKDLTGLKVLVTAGPTREPLDPVRFISNHSSGKMGYALAATAELRGARVTLVSGPVALPPPVNVELVPVLTAGEMAETVLNRLEEFDVIVKVAAVGDFRPSDPAAHKIKKDQADGLALTLTQNPDILKKIGEKKKAGQTVVGFAAETRDLEKHARAKLSAKNLDLIVVNQVAGADTAFNADDNQVGLFFKDGRHEQLPRLAKTALADLLWDRIRDLAPASTSSR